MEEKTNNNIEIGNLMSSMMRPSGSPEAEILDVVAKYSLQLRLDQQFVLNRLTMLAFHPLISNEQKKAIEVFVSVYCDTKRYHDTLEYIGKTVDSMSLRKFMDSQAIKGQIIKTGQ